MENQPRLNYAKISSSLAQKLTDLSLALPESSLSTEIIDLVNIRASQLNGCTFCLDMHVKEAKIHGERELRIYHISTWHESPMFNDKEKAVLAWTEAVTQLGPKGIPDETYEQVLEHLSEQELSDLTFAISIINSWNRLAISFQTPPGWLDSVYGLEKAGLQ